MAVVNSAELELKADLSHDHSGKPSLIKIYLLYLGFISIILQTLILRELMIEVKGNEIIFSISLSSWLLFISLGSLIGNRLSRIRKNKLIDLLLLIQLVLLVSTIPLIRLIASLMTPVSGISFNLIKIIILSLTVQAPVCLTLGIFFPLIVNSRTDQRQSVHKAYLIESIGILLGGIFLYFLLDILSAIMIIYLLVIPLIFGILFLGRSNLLKITSLLIVVSFGFGHYYLSDKINSSRYPDQQMLMSTDSRYGRTDVTYSGEQTNYFWNGSFIGDTGYNLESQKIIGFLLIEHPNPRTVMIVGSLLNGFGDELLSYLDIGKIVNLELDKNLIDISAEMFPTSRITYLQSDMISFMKKNDLSADIIFLNLPDPTSLSLNRYYTSEFFAEVSSRINQDQLFAITVGSGINYLSPEFLFLNATLYQTIREHFEQVVIIPGEENLILAGNGNYLTDESDVLIRRFYERNIIKPAFNQGIIAEHCNSFRVRMLKKSLESQLVSDNTIDHPRAYLAALYIWIKKAGIPGLSFSHQNLSTPILVIFSLMIILIIYRIIATAAEQKTNFPDLGIYLISLSGFCTQLLLLNYYQLANGDAYFYLFLFTASFMLGIASGYFSYRKFPGKTSYYFLLNALSLLLIYFYRKEINSIFLFLLINYSFAYLEGIISAKLLQIKCHSDSSDISGIFYSMDSSGAMAGGFCVGILLIPLTGLQTSFLLLILILLICSLLSFYSRKSV